MISVYTGILLEKKGTGHRFHRPIEIVGFELPLDFDMGFDLLERDAATGDRLQAEPTFVLCPVTNI